MKTQAVTSNHNSSNKGKNKTYSLNEALDSLTKALAILKSLDDAEVNSLLSNIESSLPNGGIDYYQATRQYETKLIKTALKKSRGNQTKAAKLLKLNISTLNAIIKRYGINY